MNKEQMRNPVPGFQTPLLRRAGDLPLRVGALDYHVEGESVEEVVPLVTQKETTFLFGSKEHVLTNVVAHYLVFGVRT